LNAIFTNSKIVDEAGTQIPGFLQRNLKVIAAALTDRLCALPFGK
jgi:hypothetical protein